MKSGNLIITIINYRILYLNSHSHSPLSSPKQVVSKACVMDSRYRMNLHTYIFFIVNIYLILFIKTTQTQYKQTCSCIKVLVLCGARTRYFLRSRRAFEPLLPHSSHLPTPAVVINGKVSY
jgi:hypothetical protein